MRTFRVVVSAPFFDYYLRFLQRVEYLPVQQFVSQAGVEALNVTVLPCTARQAKHGIAERVILV